DHRAGVDEARIYRRVRTIDHLRVGLEALSQTVTAVPPATLGRSHADVRDLIALHEGVDALLLVVRHRPDEAVLARPLRRRTADRVGVPVLREELARERHQVTDRRFHHRTTPR